MLAPAGRLYRGDNVVAHDGRERGPQTKAVSWSTITWLEVLDHVENAQNTPPSGLQAATASVPFFRWKKQLQVIFLHAC